MSLAARDRFTPPRRAAPRPEAIDARRPRRRWREPAPAASRSPSSTTAGSAGPHLGRAQRTPATRCEPDTIMYGASLTKAVFAYTVMQLVDEGRIDLDRSIADYLPRPLPDYDREEDRYAPWQTSRRRRALAAGSRRASCSPTAPASPISPCSSPTGGSASISIPARATPIRARA